MDFEKERAMFKAISQLLNGLDYDNMPIETIINHVLNAETELWRTRINIENKLGQK